VEHAPHISGRFGQRASGLGFDEAKPYGQFDLSFDFRLRPERDRDVPQINGGGQAVVAFRNVRRD